MKKELYPAIFKRKSFHTFKLAKDAAISPEELKDIETVFPTFKPLIKDIETAIRIVPAQGPGLKRDAEYCILLYSEKKDNYLINIGYIGEQLDLYLASKNIGALWFGFGRTKMKAFEDLEFVIMIAIGKIVDSTEFRNDISEAKRIPVEEMWEGDTLGIAEVARLAPSACNTQPWFVENKDGVLTVYRQKKAFSFLKIPLFIVCRYNRIDIGIFLCFLELALADKAIKYTRELFVDDGDKKDEFTKVAEYKLTK